MAKPKERTFSRWSRFHKINYLHLNSILIEFRRICHNQIRDFSSRPLYLIEASGNHGPVYTNALQGIARCKFALKISFENGKKKIKSKQNQAAVKEISSARYFCNGWHCCLRQKQITAGIIIGPLSTFLISSEFEVLVWHLQAFKSAIDKSLQQR